MKRGTLCAKLCVYVCVCLCIDVDVCMFCCLFAYICLYAFVRMLVSVFLVLRDAHMYTHKHTRTCIHTQVGHTSLAEFLESFNKPQTGPRTPAGRPLSNSNSPHASVAPAQSPSTGRRGTTLDFNRLSASSNNDICFDEMAVNGPGSSSPMGQGHSNWQNGGGLPIGPPPGKTPPHTRTTRTFVM